MGSALIASFLSMTIIDKIRKSVNIIAKLKRQVKAQSLICVVLIFSVPDAEFISKSHILITLTTVTVDNVKILCKTERRLMFQCLSYFAMIKLEVDGADYQVVQSFFFFLWWHYSSKYGLHYALFFAI